MTLARKCEQGYASLATYSSYERTLRRLANSEDFRQCTNKDLCLLGAGKVSGR